MFSICLCVYKTSQQIFALLLSSMKTIFRSLFWCLLLLWPCVSYATPSAAPSRDLTLLGSEWASPNIIRIPFTLTGTLITVRARLDTLEGNFFFDTGASSLLLNYRYLNRPVAGASENASGITGKVRVLGATKVNTFVLDNLQVVNVTAECIDMTHIERSKKKELLGIIGYRVFDGFEVLFDYESSRIVLIRTDSKGNPLEALPNWEYQPLGNVPVVTAGHVAIIKLQFAGRSAKSFALDSGAEQNLLNVTTNKRFLKEYFEVGKRVKLNGAGKESVEVLSGRLKNAQVDTFFLKPMSTLLLNLTEINTIYQTNVDGVLGYEFLSQLPMSINYRKRRLYFYNKPRP